MRGAGATGILDLEVDSRSNLTYPSEAASNHRHAGSCGQPSSLAEPAPACPSPPGPPTLRTTSTSLVHRETASDASNNPTMASKNICTRCLRMAAVPIAPPAARRAANRRTFASSAAVQSSKQRQIHHSARQSAAPGVDSLHQPANEAPPYSTPRGRTTDKQRDESRVMLQPNNLFHSFSNSPSPAIRQRAAVMKQNAYCPHPEHQATRTPTSPNDLESRKTGSLPPAHVRYECPDCGIPVSCSEEHFADDYEAHLEICDQLREINEDDHDLVSGRFFPEFEYPAATMDEAQVNLTNWDTLMYSREFNAVNDERAMRQVTRLLTYPITVGSVLHELSPYSISRSGRLTSEGLRSMSGRLTRALSCIQPILMHTSSAPLHPSPPTLWCRHHCQGSPTKPPTGPHLHPRRSRRIVSPPRSLAAALAPLSPHLLPPNLHWPREHGEP